MGLIKALAGGVGGVLADQWKEYFYCDALPADVICKRGQKKVSGRSSNTKGDDNIISQGSIIAVAEGQCMIIVEQGKVVDVCAEPGEFKYDNSTEPSVFAGHFGRGLLDSFKNIGKRFTFGGEAPKTQRVYYLNTKEIPFPTVASREASIGVTSSSGTFIFSARSVIVWDVTIDSSSHMLSTCPK